MRGAFSICAAVRFAPGGAGPQCIRRRPHAASSSEGRATLPSFVVRSGTVGAQQAIDRLRRRQQDAGASSVCAFWARERGGGAAHHNTVE